MRRGVRAILEAHFAHHAQHIRAFAKSNATVRTACPAIGLGLPSTGEYGQRRYLDRVHVVSFLDEYVPSPMASCMGCAVTVRCSFSVFKHTLWTR